MFFILFRELMMADRKQNSTATVFVYCVYFSLVVADDNQKQNRT